MNMSVYFDGIFGISIFMGRFSGKISNFTKAAIFLDCDFSEFILALWRFFCPIYNLIRLY